MMTPHTIHTPTQPSARARTPPRQVMAILVKVPNTLRWPDVLAALQPRMTKDASSWADTAIAAASDPHIW